MLQIPHMQIDLKSRSQEETESSRPLCANVDWLRRLLHFPSIVSPHWYQVMLLFLSVYSFQRLHASTKNPVFPVPHKSFIIFH